MANAVTQFVGGDPKDANSRERPLAVNPPTAAVNSTKLSSIHNGQPSPNKISTQSLAGPTDSKEAPFPALRRSWAHWVVGSGSGSRPTKDTSWSDPPLWCRLRVRDMHWCTLRYVVRYLRWSITSLLFNLW